MTESNAPNEIGSDGMPGPAAPVLIAGTVAVAALSAAFLPLAFALASTILGAFMIAGADIDARAFLLPDTVTLGSAACGVLGAAMLDPADWRIGAFDALAAAFVTAAAVALLRWGYARLRGFEGLGFGDVKLAAAVGAWLPVPAIPVCFLLAALAALIAVALARIGGQPVDRRMEIPLGAFLCPALWLTYYASVLPLIGSST